MRSLLLQQGEHRRADVLALADVPFASRGLHEVVNERVDAPRARRAEQLDLFAGEVGGVEHAGADRVVDVVVDVSDAVDELHDLALERVRLVRAGVVENPVAHLGGQVQAAPVPLQDLDHSQRVLVVVETAAEALVNGLIERLLARMTERRVAEVVPEPDRLDEVLVQSQRPGDAAGNAGRLERVREPRAVVVALRVDEDLGLVLQPAEGLRVDDAVAVALKRRAQAAFLLLERTAAGFVRAHGQRRERGFLLLPDPRFERVRDPPGKFGHTAKAR